jgi:hypothetical protein
LAAPTHDAAVVADPALYNSLRDALSGTGIVVAAGPDAVVEAATLDADWTMAAITGAAGLASTLAAIRRGKAIGYRAMRLDTDSDMLPAQRLYQSLGFRPIPKYNNDPIPDTLFFELDLR